VSEASGVAAPARPDLSVVLELDNVLHSEVSRARTTLTRVLDQIREARLEDRVEVLVMYDETAVRRDDAEQIVADAVRAHPFVRLVAVHGLRYFSLKNEGARRTTGELLVFVDSDCLPEADWLRQLLAPFDRADVDVVTGNSYVDRDTFYAKTFAAGWYFPARLPDGPLTTVPTTFANTLAMRRHIFEKYPFPEVTTLYMGQGVTWNRTLAEHGVPIFLNPRARVAHPPPVFLRSAIVNGYDTAERTRRPGQSVREHLRETYWGFRLHMGQMHRRITQGHRDVRLPRAAVPFAIGLASVYWSLWSLAELVARFAPGLIPHKHLR
jgi:GT2 family glycosyltransferase